MGAKAIKLDSWDKHPAYCIHRTFFFLLLLFFAFHPASAPILILMKLVFSPPYKTRKTAVPLRYVVESVLETLSHKLFHFREFKCFVIG